MQLPSFKMGAINDILKPKSRNELRNSIEDFYNILFFSEEEFEYFLKLYNIIKINKAKNKTIEVFWHDLKKAREDIENKGYITYNVGIRSKIVEINKKIESWNFIYNELIRKILENSIIVNVNINNIRENILFGLRKLNYGDFILCNENTYKFIKNIDLNIKIVIQEDFEDNLILIGKKDVESFSAIQFFIFKNYYWLNEISDIKNSYYLLKIKNE
jgi:hypothetical protein